MVEKNNQKKDIKKFAGILFELKVGLSSDSKIVIDYGGKPVAKLRDALKGYNYHANLCAAIIGHCNGIGKKLEGDVKKIIETI
tara:strand:+ start:694 stop:942 length:249 start_codon:yes stop_codon:yes gene_type:complete